MITGIADGGRIVGDFESEAERIQQIAYTNLK